MSRARSALSRTVRVGDGTGIGGYVVPAMSGGRVALSRTMRVWAPSYTDTFLRTVAGGWGTTTGNTSQAWATAGTGTTYEVTDPRGLGAASILGTGYAWATLAYTDPANLARDATIRFGFDRLPENPAGLPAFGDFVHFTLGHGTSIGYGEVTVCLSAGHGVTLHDLGLPSGGEDWAALTVDLTAWTCLRTLYTPGTPGSMSVWLWNGDLTDQPASPLGTVSVTASGSGTQQFGIEVVPDSGYGWTFTTDTLNIVGSADW